jgi:Tfp pilus assembly protein PilO
MEAVAILIVFAVTVIIFLVTWLGTVNGARNPVAELAQLEQYRETLQKKALRAQLERWDNVMMDQIAAQLEDVEHRIARLANRA